MIQAIVFDMDGVLVDAAELHRVALNRALVDHRFQEISLEEHLSRFNGLPTKIKLRQLGCNDEEVDKIGTRKQEVTLELVREKVVPDPQLVALLQALSKKYKLGCASNSIRHSVEEMLYRKGVRELFQVVLSNEDVKAPKPDPEIYRRACVELDLSPSEVLVVEDNRHGQRAVVASGCRLCPVRGVLDVTYEHIVACINAHHHYDELTLGVPA